jgi:hypothetical protein
LGESGVTFDVSRTAEDYIVERKTLLKSLALAVVGIPALSMADNTGSAGRVIAFSHNAPASDEYPISRGGIVVKPWQAPEQEYRWGGSACPGKNLDPYEEALLERAFLSRRVIIQPYFQNGQGGHLCLVAFEMSR